MSQRQEDIDRLTRDLLQQGDQRGDWDNPGDQVWDHIAQRIQPTRRRPVLFWWVLTGVSILILTVLVLQAVTRAPNTDTRTAESANHATIASQESDLRNSNSQPTTQHKAESTVTSSPQSSGNTILDSETGSDEATAFESQQRDANSIQRTSQETQPLNGDSKLDRARAPKSDINRNTKSNAPESSFPGATSIHQDDSGKIGQFDIYPANMEPDAVKAQQERIPVMALPHLDFSPLTHPLTASTEARSKVDIPAISLSHCAGRSLDAGHPWSLALAISPSWGTRRILTPQSVPIVRRQQLLAQETPALRLGASVHIGYTIGRRLSILGGLEYSPYRLQNSSIHQVRYTRAGERINARGNFENSYALNLNNSYGDASTDIVVERSSDAQVIENRFINIRVDGEQSLQVLRIPLSLQYRKPAGRLQFAGYAGISGQVLMENTLEITAVRSLTDHFVDARTARAYRLKGGRKFGLGYQAGISIEMLLDRRVSLQLGPSVNGYLQPLYANREIKVFPVMADFDLGIRYRL